MRYSLDFIDKVRDSTNIVEVIGQHTELKGSGPRLTGRCPFPDHHDKSPSFSVSTDSQLYYCYGCRKGGNVFTFLEAMNGMLFPEAIEFLARKASIPLPAGSADEASSRRTSRSSSRVEKDTFYQVNGFAADLYYRQLHQQTSGSKVWSYLASRQLERETVETFRLGYASDDWQGLVRYLERQKISMAVPEKLGLIKSKDGESRGERQRWDLFRSRLMFPIIAPTGDVLGFGGRTLDGSQPKYVNSSESSVFSKGRILYGLHQTGKFIRAQDEALVVEGYMDAIMLFQAGIKNVVAILGTALTSEHARLLRRYTPNVRLLLDGDEAGVLGAERALPLLLGEGLRVKGFALPKGMDPDDFVKASGTKALEAELERAPDLFNFLLTSRWMRNFQGAPSDKIQVLSHATSVLSTMQDRQLMDLYIVELARQLDVEVSWVRQTLWSWQKKAKERRGNDGSKSAISEGKLALAVDGGNPSEDGPKLATGVVSVIGAPRDEAFVLSLLLHSETLIAELVEAEPDQLLKILSHEGIRQLVSLALEKYRQKPDLFASLAASLASQIDQPSVITCALELTRGLGSEAEERKLMSDYLNAIRKRFLVNQAKALTVQLRDQASPEKLEQFMNLQRDRLSLDRG